MLSGSVSRDTGTQAGPLPRVGPSAVATSTSRSAGLSSPPPRGRGEGAAHQTNGCGSGCPDPRDLASRAREGKQACKRLSCCKRLIRRIGERIPGARGRRGHVPAGADAAAQHSARGGPMVSSQFIPSPTCYLAAATCEMQRS